MDAQRPARETHRPIQRFRDGAWVCVDDAVSCEEPMEIRLLWEAGGGLQRRSIAITMRTPGDDFALAAGFLFGEGIVRALDDIVDVSYCPDEDEDQAFNIVTVTLRPGLEFDPSRLERNFFTTSSCGVCGKATLDALEVQGCAAVPPGLRVAPDAILAMPTALRHAQAGFAATGGIHAAGLFAPDGTLVAMKEDVGRHNALDKVIGEQLLAGRTDLGGHVLLLSGRASFELLQKALVARIPVVCAVGAPSSLAIDLAESFSMTLVGFVRPGNFNVYTGRERIQG
ncbi:MAG: formate dehydrogenase accessory sulfurtransferase FdhD [Dehalococcoidia bacterium]|nr:formate dehydrogenase accessory sulfurtransferase FdhD [Dehalococcoidia bacterium]